MKVGHQPLEQLVTAVFEAAGCEKPEAAIVSEHLVAANLAGHDSHGVIRVPIYADWLRDGKVLANQEIDVVFENDVIAVTNGRLGLGQSIAHQAMQLGLKKSQKSGVAVVSIRNAGHVGRVGHWAEMLVREGKISLHFVNTSGLGMLVAPVGGINRRLSANPLAIGIPMDNDEPIILDISTSSIAEGKLKVAFNKGVPVADGCIIDADGNPTCDPKIFYGDPPGAILPFGGHKGYGLGFVTEILAGALTGGGCTKPGQDRLEQGMLSIILDPEVFQESGEFFGDIRQFVEWVKSSEKVSPDAEIFVPGDVERRSRAGRLAEGIELDEKTCSQLARVAESLGVSADLTACVQQANSE